MGARAPPDSFHALLRPQLRPGGRFKKLLMLEIMSIVERHGLEMAFPTRTVYFRDEQYASKGSPREEA